MNNTTSQQGWLPKDRYEERNVSQSLCEYAAQPTAISVWPFELTNGLKIGTIENLGEGLFVTTSCRLIEDLVQGEGSLDECCQAAVLETEKRAESSKITSEFVCTSPDGRKWREVIIEENNTRRLKKIPLYTILLNKTDYNLSDQPT